MTGRICTALCPFPGRDRADFTIQPVLPTDVLRHLGEATACVKFAASKAWAIELAEAVEETDEAFSVAIGLDDDASLERVGLGACGRAGKRGVATPSWRRASVGCRYETCCIGRGDRHRIAALAPVNAGAAEARRFAGTLGR